MDNKKKEKVVMGIAGLLGVIAYNIYKNKEEEKEMERYRIKREKEINEMFKNRNDEINQINDIFNDLESKKNFEKRKEKAKENIEFLKKLIEEE